MAGSNIHQKFKDSTVQDHKGHIFSNEGQNKRANVNSLIPSLFDQHNPIRSADPEASVIYGNFSAAIINEQKKRYLYKDEKRTEKRKRAYKLKEISAALVMQTDAFTIRKKKHKNGTETKKRERPAVWHCCKSPVTMIGKEKIDVDSIQYVIDKYDRKHFLNLQHCENYWLCPVCAGAAAADRSDELFYTLQSYIKMGYAINFVTLTFPHYANQNLDYNLNLLIRGFDWCKNHRSTKAILKRGFEEFEDKLIYVRALEPTIGKNGWHPHLHCIFITKPDQTEEYIDHFKSMWLDWLDRNEIFRAGAYEHAVNVKPYEGESLALTNYMCKWGIVQEISHTQQKIGRQDKEGYSPFEILGIIHDKIEWDLKKDPEAAFKEYAVAFKGKSMIRYSTEFFAFAGIDIEELRIQIKEAKETTKKILFEIDLTLWYKLMNKSLLPDIHTAYEAGGIDQVHNLFLDNQIRYKYTDKKFIFDYSANDTS